MDKIQTTDCYVPVDEETAFHVTNYFQDFYVEKKEGVIVLTEKEFKDMAELLKRAYHNNNHDMGWDVDYTDFIEKYGIELTVKP